MIPKKVLAIKLRSLGDTVLMTAPLIELRRAYPEAEIHAAVMSPWGTLLENHPAIDQVWSYERHKRTAARAKALTRLGLKLRKERFDLVVNFHASPSSATIAYATGARTRSIHFHGHQDKNRFSTVMIPSKGTIKPIIERDMDALRALGIEIPVGRLPQIFLHNHEKENTKAMLESKRLGSPILAIGLGASRPTKSWAIDRFAGLAAAWVQRTHGSVIAVGSTREMPLFQEFLKKLDDEIEALNLKHDQRAQLRARIACEIGTPLRTLTSVISQSSVFVGNDSGPKHLAVAVGTPTVTLFGPESPFEWHPYPLDRNPYFFIENLDCRRDADPGMPPWCGLDRCIDENHRCMDSIGINAVLQKCEELLTFKVTA